MENPYGDVTATERIVNILQEININEKNWMKGIDGTINAVFRCTQAIIPFMKRNGDGSIINIGSMYGIVSLDPGIYGDTEYGNPPNYGAGKSAITQFTRFAVSDFTYNENKER